MTIGNPFDDENDTDSQYIHPDVAKESKNHLGYTTNVSRFVQTLLPEHQSIVFELAETGNRHGTKYAQELRTIDPETGEMTAVAWLGTHTDTQGIQRILFELNGTQVKRFDLTKLHQYLTDTKSTITRIDLAVDDFEGKRGFDYACDLYKQGKIHSNGRIPTPSTYGDTLTRKNAVTLYLGKRENGKQMCIYEKGKQINATDTPELLELKHRYPNWVRWELRLGNKDRVIPIDTLIKPAAKFLGAYSIFPEVFPDLQSATIEHIRITSKVVAEADLAKKIKHIATQGGRLLYYLAQNGVSNDQLMQVLARPSTAPKWATSATKSVIVDLFPSTPS